MKDQNLVNGENFIRIYDNVLPNDLIDGFFHMGEQSVTWTTYSQENRYDSQITIDPFWPKITIKCNNHLIRNVLSPYMDDFPYLKGIGSDWWSGSLILQKTKPLQGFHSFHCEDVEWANRHRILSWMVYINDVEEGGETEWLYQQLKIKPKRNTCVIWPGSFTHLHRGNPPISGTKYILTGWFAIL